LVVDDDQHVVDACARWLRLADIQVVSAGDVANTLAVASSTVAHLAVVDYLLPDGSGLDLAIRLRARYGLQFVLISGYLTVPLTVAAMRAGAIDVLEKPLECEKLIAHVKEAIQFSPVPVTAPASDPQRSMDAYPAAERWAGMILAAISTPADPRTVPLWGRAIGAGAGTIEETCRLCGVAPRQSRDLARMLRALSLSHQTKLPVTTFLEVWDTRTATALLRRAGLQPGDADVPLGRLLKHQGFVPRDTTCFRILAHRAANHSTFWRG
jgi:ActR/RegA family two-component response regulator